MPVAGESRSQVVGLVSVLGQAVPTLQESLLMLKDREQLCN